MKRVVQPTRRIPFALRNKADVELKLLEDYDIIEPATGPTHGLALLMCSQSLTNLMKYTLVR